MSEHTETRPDPDTDTDYGRHGTCTRCQSRHQDLVLACVRQLEDRCRELNWVCDECVSALAVAKLKKEAAVRRLHNAAMAQEARGTSRRIRQPLLHGRW
jgi:hypothetical protein